MRLVGTTFSRSHMTCFQTVGNAKPNGHPACSLPMHMNSWFRAKTFWEWVHQEWCLSVSVCVCGIACVRTCTYVLVMSVSALLCQLPLPTSTYSACCSEAQTQTSHLGQIKQLLTLLFSHSLGAGAADSRQARSISQRNHNTPYSHST